MPGQQLPAQERELAMEKSGEAADDDLPKPAPSTDLPMPLTAHYNAAQDIVLRHEFIGAGAAKVTVL